MAGKAQAGGAAVLVAAAFGAGMVAGKAPKVTTVPPVATGSIRVVVVSPDSPVLLSGPVKVERWEPVSPGPPPGTAALHLSWSCTSGPTDVAAPPWVDGWWKFEHGVCIEVPVPARVIVWPG